MIEHEIHGRGIRFSIKRDGKEVGRARLYILHNDLHAEPFGLLEDVFVDDQYRRQKIAEELVLVIIERARNEGCYKLIATSRDDVSKEAIHAWYQRLGFLKYGIELRINF